ncbi:MAG: SPFH domain-containing protein [Gemmatimonadales bacterium]|nr:SPFH domain-containing protein [Gemmatimonadales bacterium]MDZ4391062.1 SPFH domain-containing protein [Gemmatimonadales bacterium]
MDTAIIGTVGAVLLGVILGLFIAVKTLIVICLPNEMVVITGRRRLTADGREIGYRILRGGRTLRIPLIERVSRIDLRTIPIEVAVRNAYSLGGIPLLVQGIANVKVSGRDPTSHNAVERLLDKPFDEVMQIAKDTLEGNLRGVLATLTPEEVNEDRLKFAQRLIEEADEDLRKLGLELDTLKIQNVTDEVNYLGSIGRQKTAEILKISRVAEAQRDAEAEQTEAASRQAAQVASLQADLRIAEESNRLRVRKAELEGEAVAREAEAAVAGEKARVVAEQTLQQERISLEQRRLEADVLLPARAEQEAAEARAKGVAATIAEDGKAKLFVLEQTIKLYQSAGSEAERIFVLNMLPEIIKQISRSVGDMDIDKVTIFDTGNGASGVANAAGQLPTAIIQLTQQIEAATGVNILSRLQRVEEKRAE